MRVTVQVQADLAVNTLLQLLLCMCACTAASKQSQTPGATIGSAIGECNQTKSSQTGHHDYHDFHGQQKMTHEPASFLKSAYPKEAGQFVSHDHFHHGIHKVLNAIETKCICQCTFVLSYAAAGACAALAGESPESAELAEP